MAEQLLNMTGLTYFKGLCDTKYENKIEKIKVNGTEQTIDTTDKSVNVQMPRLSIGQDQQGKTSLVGIADSTFSDGINFEKDTNGISVKYGIPASTNTPIILTSKDYVDANGGKIDKIKINGIEQTITNKEVDLPTAINYDYDTSLLKIETGGSSGTKLEIKKSTSIRGYDFTKTNLDSGYSDTITLASTEYVDNKGSVTIDSTNNNKTTFTNGTKTSSITTSPDGIIYTEGASATVVPSKAYVDDAIAGVTGMEFVVVNALPTEGEKGNIYLISNGAAGSNVYDEYIWIQDSANGRFEKIGSTAVDLSNYLQQDDIEIITTAQIDALFV